MMRKILTALRTFILNKKRWLQRYRFRFFRRLIRTLLYLLPSVLYFCSVRFLLLISFFTVIFVLNIALVKLTTKEQNNLISPELAILRDSYSSILNINRKTKLLNITNKKMWKFWKLNKFFLWLIKYNLIVNKININRSIINIY